MPEAEFIAATARMNRDNLGTNGGWQRYSIKVPISDDRKIGIFLVFRNGRLRMVSFAWAPKDETWDDWSEATELAREKEYKQAIASQVGGKNTFVWGKINAQLDSKSGGTDIWVDYGEPAT